MGLLSGKLCCSEGPAWTAPAQSATWGPGPSATAALHPPFSALLHPPSRTAFFSSSRASAQVILSGIAFLLISLLFPFTCTPSAHLKCHDLHESFSCPTRNFSSLTSPLHDLPHFNLHSCPLFSPVTFPAAATAAKSLQSCPTLCDPIDSSPPGFLIPGILQARTLEWVTISFSNA